MVLESAFETDDSFFGSFADFSHKMKAIVALGDPLWREKFPVFGCIPLLGKGLITGEAVVENAEKLAHLLRAKHGGRALTIIKHQLKDIRGSGSSSESRARIILLFKRILYGVLGEFCGSTRELRTSANSWLG